MKNLLSDRRFDPEKYYRQIWQQLKNTMDIIFRQDTRAFSMEELYRGVENICRQGQAKPLFLDLERECRTHVANDIRKTLLDFAETASDVEILAAVTEAWATWRRQLTTVRSIFYYLDRSYLLHSAVHPRIDDLGTRLFCRYVFSDPTLKPEVLDGACALVQVDRARSRAETVDPKQPREVVSMLHSLCVYTADFEPQLLRESETFFETWASTNSSGLSLGEYVHECGALLDREITRCRDFGFDDATKRKLVAQMEEAAIAEQELRLTRSSSFGDLMARNELGSLRALFDHLQRRSLGEKLRPALEEYINTAGSSIVFDENRVPDMVVRLLHFKKKLDHIWVSCFKRHQNLGYGLKEAFENFMNKTEKTKITWNTDNDKPGEMIAKYLDTILRGGAKAIPQNPEEAAVAKIEEDEDDDEGEDEDEQMNKQLDQVLELFRFVRGKATFEAFYKKDLAKRLLMNRSASADAEKSMLTRLKSECGANFTQNLEQMFKDVELAREENSSYKMLLEEKHVKPTVDLNVNILSAAAWPTYSDAEVEIPREIQTATSSFEQHYKAKHSGRRLQWKHGLAHCQMRANFPRGNKEIIVSSFQAAVMLYFNEKTPDEAVGYSELQAATKLTDVELKRTLQSLACARYRVLTKTPKGRDVNPTDRFTLNANFSDPKYRIKINQIQLKETREENRQTHERVAADRQYETQAAIVRIMKGKKKLLHAQLVAAVIDATKSRGAINPEDIKKQIEK